MQGGPFMKAWFKRVIVVLLTWEARLVLAMYAPKIIAVTGSVGKTSTKDAIYAVLSRGHHVRKSAKSFNSELGVPLTILGLPNRWRSATGWLMNLVEGFLLVLKRREYPDWLVLEVGADRPGDIAALAWLRPHIVVYTRFPDVPVHVEYFSSKEAVIEEKRHLGRALREDGLLVCNADDPAMQHELVRPGQRIAWYGFAKHADVRGARAHIAYDHKHVVGVACEVHSGGDVAPLSLRGTLGRHHLGAALAAVAVGRAVGVSLADAVAAFDGYEPPPGRMRILAGMNGSTIIDDSYNASPAAVTSALESLGAARATGRKIVVLGDMLELGAHSIAAHQAVGVQVAAVANIYITVGVRMLKAAAEAQAAHGTVAYVATLKTSLEAGEGLRQLLQPGDLVLIKGSQSTRMERAVEMVLAEPERAGEFLVRQEAAWRER